MDYELMRAEQFITESNKIEGINRPPLESEIEEYFRFTELEEITIEDLEKFVNVYQPKARLRDKHGLNVRVGSYHPPKGGPQIRSELTHLLFLVNQKYPSFTPYKAHQAYEKLHPFTDGNGRSGRMLWLWQMKEAPLGFLHTWYYQSLSEER